MTTRLDEGPRAWRSIAISTKRVRFADDPRRDADALRVRAGNLIYCPPHLPP
jgi:hypothetical protein